MLSCFTLKWSFITSSRQFYLDTNGTFYIILDRFSFPLSLCLLHAVAAVINCLIVVSAHASCTHRAIFCASVAVRQRFRRHCARGYNFRKRGVKSVFIGRAFSGVLTHILCSRCVFTSAWGYQGPGYDLERQLRESFNRDHIYKRGDARVCAGVRRELV